MNTYDLFFKTLNEMPEIFTSNTFCKQAEINGVEARIIHDGYAAKFLKETCIQYESRRTWKKQVTSDQLFPPVDKLTESISYLKSLGYKVMKPVNTFEEV